MACTFMKISMEGWVIGMYKRKMKVYIQRLTLG